MRDPVRLGYVMSGDGTRRKGWKVLDATSFQSPNPFTLWCMVSNIIFFLHIYWFLWTGLDSASFFFFLFFFGVGSCLLWSWRLNQEHWTCWANSWALPVPWAESSKVAPDKLSTPVVRRPLRHTETVFICGSRYPHVAGRPLKCTQTAEKWNILGNFNLNLNSPPGLAIPF